MTFEAPSNEIRVMLERADAELLSKFFSDVWHGLPEEFHNVNHWMAYTKAQRLRELSNDCGEGLGVVKGTLWQLAVGELFWTSYRGDSFKSHPIVN